MQAPAAAAPRADVPDRRRRGRRAVILEAATELFLDEGYGATSIDSVVKRVGGSKSTVYAHFRSKEALFEAVVESVLSELAASAETALDETVDLEEGLRRIGERLYALVLSARHVALARLVIAEARRFPEIGRIYYERGPGRAYRWLALFLARQARAGCLAIDDEGAAADWFASKLVHRAFFEHLCIGSESPAADVEDVVKGFLKLYAVPVHRGEREGAGACG